MAHRFVTTGALPEKAFPDAIQQARILVRMEREATAMGRKLPAVRTPRNLPAYFAKIDAEKLEAERAESELAR